MDDLLIRGGHVIDGTGAPGQDADVSIAAGRIVAIEPRSSRQAYRAIDARGQVVAPGLIDIHTHSDFTLPLNLRAGVQDPHAPAHDCGNGEPTGEARGAGHDGAPARGGAGRGGMGALVGDTGALPGRRLSPRN